MALNLKLEIYRKALEILSMHLSLENQNDKTNDNEMIVLKMPVLFV
jgi:hypothetical protein